MKTRSGTPAAASSTKPTVDSKVRTTVTAAMSHAVVAGALAVMLVGVLAGCAAGLVGGAAAGGALDAQQLQTGKGMIENAQKVAGQANGRVPEPTYKCPADAEAVSRLMQTVGGGSQLDAGEKQAAEVLYRAALSCDVTLAERYLEWSRR